MAALPGWTLTAGALARVESVAALEPALARVAELPRMRSMLVSVDGELLVEQYFHGAGPNRAANLKSASKSIISVLVGIALDQGHLDGIETTIDQFFPEYLDHSARARCRAESGRQSQVGVQEHHLGAGRHRARPGAS